MSSTADQEARLAALEAALLAVADPLQRHEDRLALLEAGRGGDQIVPNTFSIGPGGEALGEAVPADLLLTPTSRLGGLGSAAGLRRGYRALDNALNQQAYVDVVGDSHVFGQGGNNVDENSVAANLEDRLKGFVGQLRQLAQASEAGGAIAAGEGFIFQGGTVEGRSVTTATSGVKVCTAPLRRSGRLLNGSGLTVKLTVPAGVNSVSVVQANQTKAFNEGGTKAADVTCNYSNDGAGGGEVIAGKALVALTNTGVPIETRIPTPVKPGDVITLEAPATAQTYIAGWNLYASAATTGIIVNRIGVNGLVSGDALGGQTTGVLNLPEEEQLIAIDSCGSAWHPARTHMALLCFYSNDGQFQSGGGTAAQNGVTPAIFEANARKFCERVIANGGCVLLLSMQRSSAALGAPEPQKAYTAAYRKIARSLDHVTFADLGQVFGTAANMQAEKLQFEFATHMNENGHGVAARALWSLLNPAGAYGYRAPIAASE